jgi:hypothetical protein
MNSDGDILWLCVCDIYGTPKWVALDYGRDAPRDSNTLCCWHCDEAASPLVNDGTLGAAGNLTVEGTVGFQNPTPQGQAIVLSAAGSPSAYTAAGIAEPTTGLSVGFWVMLSEQTGGGVPGYIVSKSAQPATWPGTPLCFDVRLTNLNGSWTADVLTVAGLQTITVTTAEYRLIPGQFTRIGISYNVATGEMIAYRNGVIVGTVTVPAGPGRALDWQGHGRWYLGTHPSVIIGAPVSQQVSGIISLVRVYEGVQTQATALKVYGRGMGYLHESY